MQKQIIVSVLICLVLVAIVVGYSIYNVKTQQSDQNANIITNKQVNLSEEDRKIFEDRIIEADKKLAELSDEQEKFDTLMFKGHQLLALGRLAEANETYWSAASAQKDNPAIYTSLGNSYVEMNNYEEAKMAYRRSIELKPENTDFWIRYITFEKDKLNARADWINSLYIDALSKTKDHIDIITSYAVWLESVGNLQSSKEYWEKAIQTQPSNQKLYEQEISRLEEKLKLQ